MIFIRIKNEKYMKKIKSKLTKYILIFFKIILFILLILLKKINSNKIFKKRTDNKRCYLSPEISNKKIIHIIITRFMIDFYKLNGFDKKIFTKEYIENGIRVIKKYLFPSLQYQSCQDFIWMLNIGDKVNITYLKSKINFKSSFKLIIVYNKDKKDLIKNITKNADVLITTRIDYDDRIYYDAVNDVRKTINMSQPMFLFGYTKGFIYYEDLDIYHEFFHRWNKEGAMSIFESLIILTNKVNDLYTIYDIGDHRKIRSKLIKNYKKYGLEKLDYEPALFETDIPKFVWVRQKYSGSFKYNGKPKKKQTIFLDLNKFYGLKK